MQKLTCYRLKDGQYSVFEKEIDENIEKVTVGTVYPLLKREMNLWMPYLELLLNKRDDTYAADLMIKQLQTICKTIEVTAHTQANFLLQQANLVKNLTVAWTGGGIQLNESKPVETPEAFDRYMKDTAEATKQWHAIDLNGAGKKIENYTKVEN